MARKLYPVGIQTFSEIRKKDLFYVDKTEYIYRVTHTNGKFFFLSRPRRFGKSLLISTFKSYFEGKKELFEGLAMEKLETEWTEYPVLHFSMASGKHLEKDQLERYLGNRLKEQEMRFGIEHPAIDCNDRLTNLIHAAYHQTGKQVVILIDEYDAPLLDVIHEETQLPVLRQVMRNFYSPLKDSEPYLRFVFLTGITKFSQLSIFSELNNMTNISMQPEYVAICGITKEEVLRDMQEDIEELGMKLKLTKEQTIDKLTEFYDGYHFTSPSPDIFNPFSLLNCFATGRFGYYWFESGTPTYLIEMMRKFNVNPSDVGELQETKSSAFDAPTETMKSITPLLYQSGYITIKDYDDDLQLYALGIPNAEIRIGLFDCLLPNYIEEKFEKGQVAIAKMSAFINRGDMDGALTLMQDFLATVPYCDNTLYEGHYQQMMYVIFALLTTYRIQVEQRTAKGHTDITLETRDRIYIMELKFDKSAQEALEQIKKSDYARAFVLKEKPVTLVGINFNVKEERNFTDWIIEEATAQ